MPSLKSELPTSRLSAAITILSHLAAAFFGATPEQGHLKSIIPTFISTSFAIVGALITIYNSFVDETDFTIPIQKATLSIILMSIISSAFSLYSIFRSLINSNYRSLKAGKCICIAIICIGCYCLYQIYENSLTVNLSNNSDPTLTVNPAGLVVVVFAAAAVVGALLIWKLTLRSETPASCYNQLDEGANTDNRSKRAHNIEAASINRAVAFFKACLFCAYWCLADIAILNFIKTALLGMKNVNNDYDQDYNNDLQYWEYGQWLKHGIAVVNNILNEC